MPHVLAAVDCKGADLTAVRMEGPGIEVDDVEVKGDERGQDDRAADGLTATAAAVSEARAAAILVPEDVGGATLWYGSDPVPVATSRQALTDLGGDEPREGPANEVLIRAALGTGAGIRIVPATALPEGVGALLRW